MFKYLFCAILLFVSAVALTACQSEVEKMQALCGEIEAVSKLTDNCDTMADKLAPLSKKFHETMNRYDTNPPVEAERDAIVDATSRCLRSYLEISLGTCGTHEGVKKAQ